MTEDEMLDKIEVLTEQVTGLQRQLDLVHNSFNIYKQHVESERRTAMAQAGKIIQALDSAITLTDHLFVALPSGVPIHYDIIKAKQALDDFMAQIRRPQIIT